MRSQFFKIKATNSAMLPLGSVVHLLQYRVRRSRQPTLDGSPMTLRGGCTGFRC